MSPKCVDRFRMQWYNSSLYIRYLLIMENLTPDGQRAIELLTEKERDLTDGLNKLKGGALGRAPSGPLTHTRLMLQAVKGENGCGTCSHFRVQGGKTAACNDGQQILNRSEGLFSYESLRTCPSYKAATGEDAEVWGRKPILDNLDQEQ